MAGSRAAAPRLAVLLLAGVLASCTSPAKLQPVEEDLDWPVEIQLSPANPGETPDAPDTLEGFPGYPCRLFQRCDLADYVDRTQLCALYVLSRGEAVLSIEQPENSQCATPVERERYGLASITKSINSLLFGVAFQTDQFGTPIDLDSAAAPLLRNAGVPYPDEQVTLRQLLHMSSGMLWDEEREPALIQIKAKADGSPAGLHTTLKGAVVARLQDAAFDAERPFRYSGFDAQLLGLLVEHRVGATQADLLKRLFWRRLDTRRSAYWNADFEGHPSAHCCFYTAAGDLARLGDWVLQSYRSGADHTADWIRASVSDAVPSDLSCRFRNESHEFRYGYQWWLPSGERNGFTGIGMRGQFLHLFPEQNVVIVQFGRTEPDPCEAMLVHRLIADTVSQEG